MPQRPRRSDEDTRRRMLDAALTHVDTHGLTLTLEGIHLEQVIADADVARASAYRRWPTRDAFLADVLLAVARTTHLDPGAPGDLAWLRTHVAARTHELTDPTARHDATVEGLRAAADTDYRRLLDSRPWRTYLALQATCQGLPEGTLRDRLGDELAEATTRFVAARATVYAGLTAMIGYRLTPPLSGQAGFSILSSAAGALMTGLITTGLTRPELAVDTVLLRPYATTRAAAWTLPALHLVGVVLAHIEPDPGVDWSDHRLGDTLAQAEGVAAALRLRR